MVIFGVGDFAAIARFYYEHDSDHEVVAYTVSRGVYEESHFEGLPVVCWRH